jgi:hypothetical protein
LATTGEFGYSKPLLGEVVHGRLTPAAGVFCGNGRASDLVVLPAPEENPFAVRTWHHVIHVQDFGHLLGFGRRRTPPYAAMFIADLIVDEDMGVGDEREADRRARRLQQVHRSAQLEGPAGMYRLRLGEAAVYAMRRLWLELWQREKDLEALRAS